MNNYNKIIEVLDIRFVDAKNIEVLKPVLIDNNYGIENHLILVTGGEIKFGPKQEIASKGDLIFIPNGKPISISYGLKDPVIFSKDDFLTSKSQYFKQYTDNPQEENHYSFVAFQAKAFNSVNFFSSMDIPAFIIDKKNPLGKLVIDVNEELSSTRKIGVERVVKILTDKIVIDIIRYITDNELFVKQLSTNSSYFKDPRLLKIFTYIKENLANDLSNKTLAKVINISDDYIGQFFRVMTKINPQDYIEYQRMEAAVILLRTSKMSIKKTGQAVGYRDTAYFCRRFKMMFGITAGKMRKRDH